MKNKTSARIRMARDFDTKTALPSRSEKHLKQACDIGMLHLKKNKWYSIRLKDATDKWRELHEEENEKTANNCMTLQELSILSVLRALENMFKLTPRYLDQFLNPTVPPEKYDVFYPSELSEQFSCPDLISQLNMIEFVQEYHRILRGDPSHVKELLSVWDKKPDDVFDFCEGNDLPSLTGSKYTGQKHLILLMRINTHEKLDDVILPEIKRIIIANRKRLEGFPIKRLSNKSKMQADAFISFESGEAAYTILQKLEISINKEKLKPDEIKRIMRKVVYSVQKGKNVIYELDLTDNEKDRLSLSMRKYLNGMIDRRTNFKKTVKKNSK